MMIPTIHLNGTSQHELLQQHIDAANALRTALERLNATAPNGRDYYPQGADKIARAIDEHAARVSKVTKVLKEIEAMAEAISDGGHRRGI